MSCSERSARLGSAGPAMPSDRPTCPGKGLVAEQDLPLRLRQVAPKRLGSPGACHRSARPMGELQRWAAHEIRHSRHQRALVSSAPWKAVELGYGFPHLFRGQSGCCDLNLGRRRFRVLAFAADAWAKQSAPCMWYSSVCAAATCRNKASSPIAPRCRGTARARSLPSADGYESLVRNAMARTSVDDR